MRLIENVRSQWIGVLALFLVIAGGTAYAADTIGSDDVIDNSLTSADLKNNQAVKSADVANNQLNDEDVGQATFVAFQASIGTILTDSCEAKLITGIGAQGDHLLLTPDRVDASAALEYTVEYRSDLERAEIIVCNYTDHNIDDSTTHFNLLVFDAQ